LVTGKSRLPAPPARMMAFFVMFLSCRVPQAREDISNHLRNIDRFLDYARNDKEKLGKPHIFARIHLKIQVE
jgi:hypothetical protein